MKLRIAQLNFWGMPWPTSVWRKTRLAALVEVIKRQEFDIIALNEVWLKSDVKFLKDKLKNYYFSYRRKGIINEPGLVTISKFPLKIKKFVPFRRSELFSRKGVLVSECKIGEKIVQVVNTHLFHSRKLENSQTVKGQVGKIRRALDKIPTILMGDFNLDYNHIEFPGFNLISKTDFPTLNKENRYTHKLFNGLYSINLTCDLIFSNFKAKILKKDIITRPLLSDHYLIVSEIMI